MGHTLFWMEDEIESKKKSERERKIKRNVNQNTH